MPIEDEDTAEIPIPELTSTGFFAQQGAFKTVTIGARTHTGLRRSENQDHHAVVRRKRSQQVLLSDVMLDPSYEAEEVAYLLMVADGMGGAAFGEFASRVVIQTAWELTARAASWIMRLKSLDAQQVRERVQAYVSEFQRALRTQSAVDSRLAGMGTTLTAAYILGRDVVVSHIGDSRAYLARGETLKQITEDQTLAQRLVDMGGNPEDVARFHHVLSNCLSTYDEFVEAAIFHIPIREGDRLLLCSDGLTNELPDSELARELAAKLSPQATCDRLLQLALDRGGRDNITVIVADIGARSDLPPSP